MGLKQKLSSAVTTGPSVERLHVEHLQKMFHVGEDVSRLLPDVAGIAHAPFSVSSLSPPVSDGVDAPRRRLQSCGAPCESARSAIPLKKLISVFCV